MGNLKNVGNVNNMRNVGNVMNVKNVGLGVYGIVCKVEDYR